MASKDIEVDEDLPNFFDAIMLSQADEIVKEAENIKKEYNIEFVDPRVVEILDNTTMPEKSIQGTPWYQILSNINYADDFYYLGAYVDEREKLIKDGDMEEGNDCE